MSFAEGSMANINAEPMFSIAGAATATAAALTAYAFYRCYYRAPPEHVKGIPTPKSCYPYVGHLFTLSDRPVRQLMQWHQELGPVIQIHLGVKPWIVISDPHIAHEILSANGNMTSVRPKDIQDHDGRGLLFSAPTKKWRQIRTVATVFLGTKNTEKFNGILDKEVDDLLDTLTTGKNVDPATPLTLATVNFLLATCFAKRAVSTEDPLFRNIVHLLKTGAAFSGIKANLSTYLPILSMLDAVTSTERQWRKFITEERDPFYNALISETLENNEPCLVKSLVDLKEMGQLDDDDILATASDLIGAGTGTTTTTLSWALAILCSCPEVQEKIQYEIDAFVAQHQKLPTFAEREALPLMISVQKECMRFRPTTPFGAPHEVEQDVTWRGHIIPKGTTIVSNMFAMHFNNEVYQDPDEFIPERFVNNTAPMATLANAKVEQRDHFNFGWGRRMCPGAHMAEVLMFKIFVGILSKYTVRHALDHDGEPINIDLENIILNGNIMAPAPYQVRFLPRRNMPETL